MSICDWAVYIFLMQTSVLRLDLPILFSTPVLLDYSIVLYGNSFLSSLMESLKTVPKQVEHLALHTPSITLPCWGQEGTGETAFSPRMLTGNSDSDRAQSG